MPTSDSITWIRNTQSHIPYFFWSRISKFQKAFAIQNEHATLVD